VMMMMIENKPLRTVIEYEEQEATGGQDIA
jgi:hypothetical protein